MLTAVARDRRWPDVVAGISARFSKFAFCFVLSLHCIDKRREKKGEKEWRERERDGWKEMREWSAKERKRGTDGKRGKRR